MRRDVSGDFVVSADEMFILRQGLFITVFHLDPAFDEDLSSITGLDAEDFEALLKRVDEVEDRPPVLATDL